MTFTDDQLEARLRMTLHDRADRLTVPPRSFDPDETIELMPRPMVVRRRSRTLLVAAAMAIAAMVGTIVWLSRSDGGPEKARVDTGPAPTTAADPTFDDLEHRPIGEVSVLTSGRSGGVDWWLISYEIEPPRPDAEMRCTIGTDAAGKQLAGWCGGGSRGGQSAGSGFGYAHLGTQDFLMAEASRAVDEIRAVLINGETRTADLYPIPGTDEVAWLVPLPSHGDASSSADRAQAQVLRVYFVQDGVEQTIYPDLPGPIVMPPTPGRPNAEHIAYCNAIDAFRASGTTNPDGSLTAAAVPYLEAIVNTSPVAIRPASEQMLDAARSGTPIGPASEEATTYWTEHC